MKILVINGPNLNMLGIREKELYGKQDYEALLAFVRDAAAPLGIDVECFQSNSEGAIVDAIQGAYGRMDGIVINLPALLAELPEEAWFSEFVPAVTEEPVEEVPGEGDDFGLGLEGELGLEDGLGDV